MTSIDLNDAEICAEIEACPERFLIRGHNQTWAADQRGKDALSIPRKLHSTPDI
jgi:hypothetical protein